MKWSPEYKRFLCGGGSQQSGILTILDKELQLKANLDIHNGPIVKLDLHSPSKQLLIMGYDNQVVVHLLP